MSKEEKWDLHIKPKNNWLDIDFRELFRYRDLIYLFVKRDFVTFYKQTILGPLWYIIQPLINALVFTVIFGNLAKISTDGIPPFIFYMAGTVVWGYFAACITLTSNTFNQNAEIFGKVYFPRITVPIANVIISLLQFLIQFVIFIFFLFYFISQGSEIYPNFYILLLPLLVFQMAILGLGFGILISSLTTKYKDLTFVMSFGIQLWMFATPIVYPFSIIPEKYKIICSLNPMTSVVEIFKLAFLGSSSIEFTHVLISVAVTISVFVFGLFMFNKMEKNFMDTV
tara:strand:+ start:198 stop:1046 length:849 start_codon:yes stop_codon:yes gene_type:complete